MKLLKDHIHVAPVKVDRIGKMCVIPESIQAAHLDGYRLFRVLAVGPGRVNKKGILIPMEIEPGDRAICHSHVNGPIQLEDGTSIITEDQVLAVMKPSLGVKYYELSTKN